MLGEVFSVLFLILSYFLSCDFHLYSFYSKCDFTFLFGSKNSITFFFFCIFIIDSSVDGHLGCFCFLTIVNRSETHRSAGMVSFGAYSGVLWLDHTMAWPQF